MKKHQRAFLRFAMSALSLFLITCASGYEGIKGKPTELEVEAQEVKMVVDLNPKALLNSLDYWKGLKEEQISVAHILIENNSNQALKIDSNLFVYDQQTPLRALNSQKVYQSLRQPTENYLWYALLSLGVFKINSIEFPIGLILGPTITTFNVAVAHSANAKLQNELVLNDLSKKTIQPGEHAEGFLCYKRAKFEEFHFKIE